MVYDASVASAAQALNDRYYFIRQQSLWFALGFIGLGFFAFFDYHRLAKLALPSFIASIGLLFLVFVPGFGISAYGAHRWLSLPGFTVQPAELVKLTSILFLATLFQKGARTTPFLIIVGLISFVLAMLQRDLGSTVIFVLISAGIYFIAGAPLKYFLSLVPIVLVGLLGFILTSGYRRQRVLAFLDPFSDLKGFTYHISQILIALGSGGLFGLGVGQSRQKFSFIPEITTDSIFAIIGEEFGFVGAVTLIILLGIIIFRGLTIAVSADDQFGKLLAAGLTIWLGAQSVVNLAAMVALIPLTGVPLPFVSYGGSAILANLVAVGILLNISRNSG